MEGDFTQLVCNSRLLVGLKWEGEITHLMCNFTALVSLAMAERNCTVDVQFYCFGFAHDGREKLRGRCVFFRGFECPHAGGVRTSFGLRDCRWIAEGNQKWRMPTAQALR